MRLTAILLFTPLFIAAEHPPTKPTITVDFIMRDSKWMGSFPSQHYWAEGSNAIYFMWNPNKAACLGY